MARAGRWIALLLIVPAVLAPPLPAMGQQCAGDCNADSVVGVDELVVCTNVGLGAAPLRDCPACDPGQDGSVTVHDLVASVGSFLGLSLQGICRVPCQGTECNLPQATESGLVSCAEGTTVRVSSCTNRARCLRETAGRTLVGTGMVRSSGALTVGIDACRAAGNLLLVEADLAANGGGSYRTLVRFAPGAAAGSGRLVLLGEIVLDPSSEAAVQLLDELGLENFTDEGVMGVIDEVAAATADTRYANRGPGGAVADAGQVAGQDAGVQDALLRGRVPTPTPPPPTRTPPTGRAEFEIGSAIGAPNSRVTIGVTLNLSADTEVVGTLNDFGFEPGASIPERTMPMAVLARSVSATDTAIPLDDASGLPPFGTIQIHDERIAYGSIDGNVLVAGVCEGGNAGIACVEDGECSGGGTCEPSGRGQAGSVPAEHDAGSTVFPNRMPDCHMSQALEALHKDAVFSFLPPGCDPGVDCDTVRAIVISLDNLAVLPAGETLLYSCRVQAGPAEGTFPLTCEDAQASSPPDGPGLLPAACFDGEVVVQQGVPTETRTPTRNPATPTPTATIRGSVAIDVGTASGQPGETVRVDVTLLVSDAEVIGTDNRITLGPSARILQCDTSPFDFLSAVILEPRGCEANAEIDCVTARGLAISSTAIENGTVLYSCDVEILPAAEPGTFPIVCSDALAAHPAGQPYDGAGRCVESVSIPCFTDAQCAPVGGSCRVLPSTLCNNGSIIVSEGPPPTATPTPSVPTPSLTPTPTATPDADLEIRIGSTALLPNASGTFDVTLHVGAGQPAIGVLNDIFFKGGVTIAGRMMTATHLSADVGPNDTAILVDDATALPELGLARIDDEQVVYVRQAGNVLAVGGCSEGGAFCANDSDCGSQATCDPSGRGQNGTVPASHLSGAGVEGPMGDPDCVMSPEVGDLNKSAVFSFLPVGCVPGIDCDIMRAIIIGLGNLNAFPAGDTVLYSCAVHAGAGEGTFPLECADAQVSGHPDEGLLDATCVDGQVVVRTSVCGNGLVEGAEECDDGGICVGGPNELTECTTAAECPNGACRPVGGDGCAINCTPERVRRANLSPDSRAVLQLASFPITVPLSGRLGLTTGERLETSVVDPQGELITRPGEYPVAIRLDDFVLEPIRIAGLICACPRQVEMPIFGSHISASGVIACGPSGIGANSYKIVQDHVTNPGAPQNGNTPPIVGLQLSDDPECDDSVLSLEGGLSEACLEGTDEECSDPGARGQHSGTCNSPRVAEFFAGEDSPGGALIRMRIAIGLLRDGGLCRQDLQAGDPSCPSDYGPDCSPCTDDDADLGNAEEIPATTGWASAALFDAAVQKGRTMDVVDPPVACKTTADCAAGQECTRQCEQGGAACPNGFECGGKDTCGEPRCSWNGCRNGAFPARCKSSVHGSLFDCSALATDTIPDDGDGDGLSGAALAIAFPGVDSLLVGDNLTTIVLDLE